MNLKPLIKPALLFIPFGAGLLVPQVHVLEFMICYLLAGMMFFVALKLRFKALKPRKLHWMLLVLNLALGIVPYLFFSALDMPVLAQAAFFCGIAPTATSAALVVKFLNGKVGFVVSGFAVTTIGISLALFWLLPWVTGNFSPDFIADIGKTVATVLVLPLLFALLLRKLYKPAREWPKKYRTLSFLLLPAMLFLIAGRTSYFFQNNPGQPLAVVLEMFFLSGAICLLNFGIGYLAGGKKYREDASQSLGQKNTGFATYLALTYAGPLAALGPICYILWHNGWNSLQLYMHDRRPKQTKSHVKIKIRRQRMAVDG